MEINRKIEKTTKSFWGIPQDGYDLSAEVTRNGETFSYDLGFESEPVSRESVLKTLNWRLNDVLDREITIGDRSVTGSVYLQNIGII